MQVAVERLESNSHVATPADAIGLLERCILYAPDFVVNGDIINVLGKNCNMSVADVRAQVLEIGQRTSSLLQEAGARQVTPLALAQTWAFDTISGRANPPSARVGGAELASESLRPGCRWRRTPHSPP